MKKLKTFFATVAVLLCSISAKAYDFEVDGIFYKYSQTSDSEISVTYKTDYFSGDYSGRIVIPETVRFNDKVYTVTSIGTSAFLNCSNLSSIEIPNSVTSIAGAAFSRCAISSINLPNNLKSIGTQAFKECTSLSTIDIPNGVTSIGQGAFNQCI